MEGSLIEIRNGILIYDVLSSYGSSGTPIFFMDKEGKWRCCGMHTHKGSNFKEGVGFTQENLNILDAFA